MIMPFMMLCVGDRRTHLRKINKVSLEMPVKRVRCERLSAEHRTVIWNRLFQSTSSGRTGLGIGTFLRMGF